ncbi:hypothetical protein FE782_12350 [Paenibacillus antri]|uniref:NACHT domain-containing protein n=1 Tax=Paenibacillus antri TaxID=2582848 RepID=A0A5R9GH98_9BACL|nr:pentapeptide repeat-containing protein [Paenibacillus antri]TLS52143.1 hypothetical protein FE782_12350 [Paenibacillus antri]
MARFSDIEKELMDNIRDDRLLTSLAEIREAMEDIWGMDTPRIIQDYTDHGEKHCERLVYFCSKLLEANSGKKLSSIEMYLLLAGVYLHDIGMQCDVVKHPEIFEKSKQLGASFDVEFVERGSSNYNYDEQKSIRQNHNYLSIAWIDYANRTGNTVLGKASKSIPEDLVDDLMDICLYHTKLLITNCTLISNFDPEIRKQLVASILRFSDELDIDSNRVSIQTVKTFNINPFNAFYWWAHEKTRITFKARNVITINIRLNTTDEIEYGDFFFTNFIAEFQSKNKPVLTILAQNNIPMVIDDESKVIGSDRIEKLPIEIVGIINSLKKKNDPYFELAHEVRTWLRAINYEVTEPRKINDRAIDMYATLEQGTIKQKILVRCIGGEITHHDVETLDNTLDRKIPQGILICDQRVSKQARTRVTTIEGIEIFNLSEFLHNKVLGPYFSSLKALVENDKINELYVDLNCYKQEMDESGVVLNTDSYSSIVSYIDSWLKERGKMHVSLLGEFGSGKTWFCRYYAYRQMGRYIKDPINERLPILLTLRSFSKQMDVRQLINEAFVEQYKLPFLGNPFEFFQEINRRGKLVLILDGFDEMARQVDYQTVVDNFWELAKLAHENSKVILTSRTEYFRLAKESEKILAGEEFGRRMLVLEPPKFEVVYIQQFNDKQIKQVIFNKLGNEKGKDISEQILRNPNLSEMARKPVLIELLLAALEEVNAERLDSSAKVYLYATDKLLLRNITQMKTFTSTSDKLFFLCELAWEMLYSGNLQVHFTTIPHRIKEYFGEKIKDQHELDTWDFDLRSQTLLHRNAAGYYEFAHKSLAEYFVAFKFAAELGNMSNDFVVTYSELNGDPCEIPMRKKDCFELSVTFGEIPLRNERMNAVKDFLVDIVSSGKNEEELFHLVEGTRGQTFDQVKYVGGNSMTLLRLLGAEFKLRDFSRTIIDGADLINTDLTECNFEYSSLKEANLSGCVLKSTNFSNSDVSDIVLHEIEIVMTLEWSPNNKFLACGVNDDNIWIFDLDSEDNIPKVIKLNAESYKIKWFTQKDIIAVANATEGVVLFDSRYFNKKAVLFADSLALSVKCPRNESFLIGGGMSLFVWDVGTTSEILHIQEAEAFYDVALLNNDTQIAVAGRGNEHNMVEIYNIEDGTKVKEWIASKKHVKVIESFGGNVLVTLSDDQYLTVWENGKTISKIQTKGAKSRCFTVNEIDDVIFVGLNNGDILLWNKTTRGTQIFAKAHNGVVNSLSLSQDGKLLASGGTDGVICIWDSDVGSTNFGKRIRSIEAKTNCQGMKISSIRMSNRSNFDSEFKIDGYTALLEFFYTRGALLDEEQIKRVEQMKNMVSDKNKSAVRKKKVN